MSLRVIFFLQGILGVMLLSGCASKLHKLDEATMNQYNDKRFLQDATQCPESLQDKTIHLEMFFDDIKAAMHMEIPVSNPDMSSQPMEIYYDGSWQSDLTKMLKRNLEVKCNTKFSNESDVLTLKLKFSKLTSQIISIDEKNKVNDFNLVSLDSRNEDTTTTNYVMDAILSGSLLKQEFEYAKGLQKIVSTKQSALGTNYLVTVSTRSEAAQNSKVLVMPQNSLLYTQNSAIVQDMHTVILPIFSNEMIVAYELYNPQDENSSKTPIEKEKLVMSKGEITSAYEITDPSKAALVNMFIGTHLNGWDAVVGPYGWLIYDLTKDIIKNAK